MMMMMMMMIVCVCVCVFFFPCPAFSFLPLLTVARVDGELDGETHFLADALHDLHSAKKKHNNKPMESSGGAGRGKRRRGKGGERGKSKP